MQVHSGESDFDPPRFKPNPSVYLKAAETEGKEPVNCIAVEDSGSGVGSASNAGVGELTFCFVSACVHGNALSVCLFVHELNPLSVTWRFPCLVDTSIFD